MSKANKKMYGMPDIIIKLPELVIFTDTNFSIENLSRSFARKHTTTGKFHFYPNTGAIGKLLEVTAKFLNMDRTSAIKYLHRQALKHDTAKTVGHDYSLSKD